MKFTDELRYELIQDYPGCQYGIGEILMGSYYNRQPILNKHTSINPDEFKNHFRKLHWSEHRTIEQLLSIKYMKIVGDKSSYYMPGDIVEVIGMIYNNATYEGGKNNILFNLNGHYFPVQQLEPATKEEHDNFWEKEKTRLK